MAEKYFIMHLGTVLLVKNLAAMRETWVQSLGWEDPLKKGTATHSSIVTCIVHGVAKNQT